MKRLLLALVLLPLAATLAACESRIQPLRPLERVELWIPDDGSPAIQLSKPVPITPELPAITSQPTTATAEIHPLNASTTTAPATAPATQLATTAPVTTQEAATQPTTQDSAFKTQDPLPPGHKIVKIIDHNQTAKFVYNATYDNVWQQAQLLIAKMGFTLDRHDYRQGVISTKSLPSAQCIEFWKPQHSDGPGGPNNAFENTVNSQRRYVRLTISTVPNKPQFYELAVQVLVERETNTTEGLMGPLFIEGSGFGRNATALRSDYADPSSSMNPTKARQIENENTAPRWIIIGHDPDLEKKILSQLFDRI